MREGAHVQHASSLAIVQQGGGHAAVVEKAGRGEESEADRGACGVVVEHAVGVGLDAVRVRIRVRVTG